MGWISSIIPLDHYGRYVHWHVILISVGNLVVVGLMVVTFVAALLLPFPGRKSRKENK